MPAWEGGGAPLYPGRNRSRIHEIDYRTFLWKGQIQRSVVLDLKANFEIGLMGDNLPQVGVLDEHIGFKGI